MVTTIITSWQNISRVVGPKSYTKKRGNWALGSEMKGKKNGLAILDGQDGGERRGQAPRWISSWLHKH